MDLVELYTILSHIKTDGINLKMQKKYKEETVFDVVKSSFCEFCKISVFEDFINNKFI